MKKYILTLSLVVASMSIYAQNQQQDSIIHLDKIAKDKIYSIQSDGWRLTSYRNNISLTNFSNKDYVLHFPVHCKDKAKTPLFLIEFTNNYRDGHRGGLDFTSSKSDNFRKISFVIDGKKYNNPFKNYNKAVFKSFTDALKDGETLTITFYNGENEDESTLNRAIDFKLANGELLNVPVDCE